MAEFETNNNFRIFSSSLHGEGVQAANPIQEASVILREKPMFCLQTLENSGDVLICANCSNFLCSLELQLQYLERKVSRVDILGAMTGQPLENCCSCMFHCGTFYCSDHCMREHWENGHLYLCTGCIDEEAAERSPLLRFKTHARETNEIFLMVADVFAKIVRNVEKGQSVDEAVSGTSGYVRNLWWDAAIAPDDIDPATFESTLRALVDDSWDLLSAALQLQERGLDRVLSKEYFARTIGMFEQNNVGVRLESPCAKLLKELVPQHPSIPRMLQAAECIVENLQAWSDEEDSSDSCDNRKIAGETENEESDENSHSEEEKALMRRIPTGDEYLDRLLRLVYDEGMDNIFPPLDGTAFYRVICKINHSCIPNVAVRYASTSALGVHAELHALENISPGTEFLQSYVDSNLDFESRRKALAEYGIHCTCAKCAEESL